MPTNFFFISVARLAWFYNNYFYLQVRVMRKLCHPRIVSLIEEQDSPEWLFLVMELVSGVYSIGNL